jgi:RIO-like serine/threonine protein kinase
LYYLNKNKYGNYFYDKNKEKDLVCYFIDDYFYLKNVNIYLYLVDKEIVPFSSARKQKITFVTNECKTLFDVLKNTDKPKIFLNELFSFINKFKKILFFHGNLHLYNILLDKNNKFLVIDFNKSKIKKVNQYDYFFDLYTIYNNLLDFYKNDKEICLYIKDILLEYVNLKEIDFSHTHQ